MDYQTNTNKKQHVDFIDKITNEGLKPKKIIKEDQMFEKPKRMIRSSPKKKY